MAYNSGPKSFPIDNDGSVANESGQHAKKYKAGQGGGQDDRRWGADSGPVDDLHING